MAERSHVHNRNQDLNLARQRLISGIERILAMRDETRFKGRYLAFAFTNAPTGGMGDCIGSFDSLHHVERAIRQLQPHPRSAHIFDTEAGTHLNVITSVLANHSVATQ